MRSVLFTALIATLGFDGGLAASELYSVLDPCPPGWICARAYAHRFIGSAPNEETRYCGSAHHVVSKRDGIWLEAGIAYVESPDAHQMVFNFKLRRQPEAPEAEWLVVPIKEVRVFSHDRRLDTLVWGQTIFESGMFGVEQYVGAKIVPEIAAAIEIARGQLYGVIVETSAGEYWRFEVLRGASRRDPVPAAVAKCLIKARRLNAPD